MKHEKRSTMSELPLNKSEKIKQKPVSLNNATYFSRTVQRARVGEPFPTSNISSCK